MTTSFGKALKTDIDKSPGFELTRTRTGSPRTAAQVRWRGRELERHSDALERPDQILIRSKEDLVRGLLPLATTRAYAATSAHPRSRCGDHGEGSPYPFSALIATNPIVMAGFSWGTALTTVAS